MAESNQQAVQQRQTAFKLRISSIIHGQYVKEEGWNPNYILAPDGKKVSRVNVLGTVISVPTQQMGFEAITIDDGSASISVRSFDEAPKFQGLNVGDIVFVIGRPRQYGSEMYIMPEIVKKTVDKLWAELRSLELGKAPDLPQQAVQPQLQQPSQQRQQEPIKVEEESIASLDDIEEAPKKEPAPQQSEEKQEENQESKGQEKAQESPQQKIYSIIKELDSGNGAEFEQVLQKAENPEAEKIISQLLMEGEIFELSKGRLKVLE